MRCWCNECQQFGLHPTREHATAIIAEARARDNGVPWCDTCGWCSHTTAEHAEAMNEPFIPEIEMVGCYVTPEIEATARALVMSVFGG